MNVWKQRAIDRSADRRGPSLIMSFFLVLLWGTLFGILCLYLMYRDPGHFIGERYVFTAGTAFITLFLVGFRIGPFWPRGMMMSALWLIFSFGSLISALLNQDNLIGEVWQMWGVPIVLLFAFPRLTCERACSILAWSLFVGATPYIVASLVQYPLLTSYYRGVFDGPNAMGAILVLLAVGLFSILRGWMMQRSVSFSKKILALLMTLYNILVGVLILFSSSRTCLIIYLVLWSVFVISLLFDDKPRLKAWGCWLTVFTILTIGFCAISLGVAQNTIFIEMLFGKFSAAPGITPLSGREEIWMQIINEAKLFGHGNDYFIEHIGRLPHNSYLTVLGAKGIMSCLFLIAFHIISLVLAIQYVCQEIRTNGYAIAPLLAILAYLISGMTEGVVGVLGDTPQFAFLLAVGILINKFHIKTEC